MAIMHVRQEGGCLRMHLSHLAIPCVGHVASEVATFKWGNKRLWECILPVGCYNRSHAHRCIRSTQTDATWEVQSTVHKHSCNFIRQPTQRVLMDVVMSDVDHEGAQSALSIEVRDGLIYVLDQQLLDTEIQRSSLLKELLNSNGSTSVPLSIELFTRWRKYVHAELEQQSDPENTSQDVQKLNDITLLEKASLLEAADVLIDVKTVAAAAKAIAHHLTIDDAVLPLLDAFTPARTVQVLKAAPLTITRLLRLPSALHHLIIEAQIESANLCINDEVFPVHCRPPPGLCALTFLTSLSLPNTQAAACDAALLAPALGPLTALVHLDLHDCGITHARAPMLAGAIAGLVSIQHLDLSSNMLLRSGVEALLPSLEGLTNITHLSLAANTIIEARACISKLLCVLPQLKSLELTNNTALRPDKAAEAEARRSDVSAESRVESFPQLPPLQDLLVSSQALDIVDVAGFVVPLLHGVASTITRLHLSDNSLTNAVDLLCSAMQHMPHLRDLDVRGCGFSTADVRAMLESLVAAHASLGQTDAVDEEDDIVPVLERLSIGEVDQRPADYMDDTIAMACLLSRCTALCHLDIGCVDMPLHPDTLAIQNLTALTGLDMSQNLMHVEFAESLTALSGLLSWNASAMLEAAPGPSHMAALQLFTALTLLDLSENSMDDPAALAPALRELTALRSLNLAENDLLQRGSPLPAALEGLQQMQTLMLSGNPVDAVIAATLAESLAKLTGLSALMLEEMCEDGEATRALGMCLPALAGLSALLLSENKLPGSAQPLLAHVLCGMSCLQHLQLQGVGLKARSLELLANTLPQLPRLAVLGIGGNTLSPSSADAIGKAAAESDLLTELDLSSSHLGHKGLMALAPHIANFKVLQVLDLGDIGVRENKPIQGQAWAAVLAALALLPGLRELDLGSNVFTRSLVLQHIAPLVSLLTALQALYIEDCGMNAETVAAWVAATASLTGLNTLSIGGNSQPANVGDLVAQLPLLEDLSLRESGLSDNDLIVLCGGLSKLAGLRMLTLSINDLTETAVSKAAEQLPRVLIEFEPDDDMVSVDDEDDSDDDDSDLNEHSDSESSIDA
eukprot:jgi/Ulvmu1/4587/UM002_0316.1